MGVARHSTVWCEIDQHHIYERHSSFNSWLDEKGESDDIIAKYGLDFIGTPSKALFAGDYPAYLEAVLSFGKRRLHSALGNASFEEHWFNRNLAHFEGLVDALRSKSVVPFVGAGVSCASGYSSWKAHLISQAKTAGLADISSLLDSGQYEEVMHQILQLPYGRSLFIDNLKVDFLRSPSQLELQTIVLGLCPHVVITTNYDSCLELAAAQRGEGEAQAIYAYSMDTQPLIASLSHRRRAILKLHGDIKSPSECVLSREQYDAAYGSGYIDMDRPLPRKLRRVYESHSLLFIGCSLHFDRTLQVFQKVMDERGLSDIPPHFAIVEAPSDSGELVERNAFLLNVGITPIFYPVGEHFRLKEILLCATEELA